MEIERPEGDGQYPESAHLKALKPYIPPQLVTWGSMTDLTRGPFSDLNDFPEDGGTLVE